MHSLLAFTIGVGITGPGLAPVPAKGNPAVAEAVARFVSRLKQRPPAKLPKQGGKGLYLLDIEKGGATLILGSADPGWPRSYVGGVSWSADGRWVLFDATPGFGQWSRTRVMGFELTAGGVELRTLGIGAWPSLSPDGTRVAYLLNPGAVPGRDTGLYVMKTDGTDHRRVAAYGYPRWSPDGKWLLSSSLNNPPELELVDPAGGAAARPVRVTGHRLYHQSHWVGPDTLVGVVRPEKGEVAVALIDLTTPAEGVVKDVLWRRGDGLPTEFEAMYPVYLPAARRGLFVGREARGQGLYLFEPGKVPKPLEPGRFDERMAFPVISPDGRYALFVTTRSE